MRCSHNMRFVGLPGTPPTILEGLKNNCGWRALNYFSKTFPDGELYIRVSAEESPDVVWVVQSLYPNQNARIVELYLALEALQGLGFKVGPLLLLYVAYARQDRRFLAGEPVSVKALYSGLRGFGVKNVITVDVHSPERFGEASGLEVKNVLPHAFMLKRVGLKADVVLAPDKGALHRAVAFARELGVPYYYLEKYRDRVTGEVRIDTKGLDVANRDVVIVDDIISTGETLATVTSQLYKLGARSVIAVVTHALITQRAMEILERAGIKRLVTANTVAHPEPLPPWIEVVDISGLLCQLTE